LAETFVVTTPTTTISLDRQRRAQAVFTVSNLSGRAISGRARIVPANPVAAPWLGIAGHTERDFPIGGTQQFTVEIAPPADAPPGTYIFQLQVVGLDNPDEEITQGPGVTFTVPAPGTVPPAPARAFPWWIPVGVVVALLILGGGGLLVISQANARTAATATAVAAGHATATAVSQVTATAVAQETAQAAAQGTAQAAATETAVAQANAAATEAALAQANAAATQTALAQTNAAQATAQAAAQATAQMAAQATAVAAAQATAWAAVTQTAVALAQAAAQAQSAATQTAVAQAQATAQAQGVAQAATQTAVALIATQTAVALAQEDYIVIHSRLDPTLVLALDPSGPTTKAVTVERFQHGDLSQQWIERAFGGGVLLINRLTRKALHVPVGSGKGTPLGQVDEGAIDQGAIWSIAGDGQRAAFRPYYDTGLNLNILGSKDQPGTPIAIYTWSSGQPNETWTFQHRE
jgi:hypothetical protein